MTLRRILGRPMSGRLWSAVLAALLGALIPCASAQGQDSGPSLELAVKATFLYKFAPFIDWPSSAFSSPASPINLCVIGDAKLSEILEHAVHDQRVNGRPFTVWGLPSVTGNPGCHIAYIAGTDGQSAARMLDLMHGTPVLTVTDEIRDQGVGGAIHFVLEDNRVRFEVDKKAASDNGLTISSKLLSLAVRVK